MSGRSGLLVRPQPVAAEGWPAYLRFIAAENRYDSLKPLAAIAGIRRCHLLHGDPFDVAHRLGIDIEKPKGYWGSPRHRMPEGWRYVARNPLLRVCPDCIRAGLTRVPTDWDSPLVFFCPVHDRVLLDTCPQCGLEIQQTRVDWRSCECGCAFAEVHTSVTEPWMRTMSTVVKRHRVDPIFDERFEAERLILRLLLRLSATLRMHDLATLFADNWRDRLVTEARRFLMPMRRGRREQFGALGGREVPLIGEALLEAMGFTQVDFELAAAKVSASGETPSRREQFAREQVLLEPRYRSLTEPLWDWSGLTVLDPVIRGLEKALLPPRLRIGYVPPAGSHRASSR